MGRSRSGGGKGLQRKLDEAESQRGELAIKLCAYARALWWAYDHDPDHVKPAIERLGIRLDEVEEIAAGSAENEVKRTRKGAD